MKKEIFMDIRNVCKKCLSKLNIPTNQQIKLVAVGDNLKVKTTNESFWVKVFNIENGCFYASVNNDLIFTQIHGYKYKDIVTAYAYNIIEISKNSKNLN